MSKNGKMNTSQNSASQNIHREEQQWLWGWHTIKFALNNSSRTLYKLFHLRQHGGKIDELLKTSNAKLHKNCRIEEIDIWDLRKVVPDGAVHQGVAALFSCVKFFSLSEWLSIDREQRVEKCLIVACDQILDGYNLGAIIRTSVAFNVSALIVPNRNSAPFNGFLAKSAAGALEMLSIIEVSNLAVAITTLQKNGYVAYGLDERGDCFPNFPKSEEGSALEVRKILVLGQEGSGLRNLTKKTCDYLVKIDSDENFPTLNVSSAASIAIYKLQR